MKNMPTVCEKDMCAGCYACVSACTKSAITIKDEVTKYNAYIDLSKCVRCDKCKNVCPNNNHIQLREAIEIKQGWINSGFRESAASGGIATALSEQFIINGGWVCGCIFKEGKFRFAITNRREDLFLFQGSKYIKSNPLDIYKEIEKKISNKEKVLFIGLPCQCAAIKNLIGEKGTLLYTVDLICHGTPSPKLLSSFLRDKKIDIDKVQDIKFRSNNKFCLQVDNKLFQKKGIMDRYTMAYLNKVMYTDNCYKCRYASTLRGTDITLGDSWGNNLDITERKNGVSLIFVQTQKGQDLLDTISESATLLKVDSKKAIDNNEQLRKPCECPSERDDFFREIINGNSFSNTVYKMYKKQCFQEEIEGTIKILIKDLLKRKENSNE